jgi:peroxidase
MRMTGLFLILAACSGGNNDQIAATPQGPEVPPTTQQPPAPVPSDPGAPLPAPEAEVFRTADGLGNNELNPEAGAAGIALRRLVPSDYDDGIDALSGALRPNSRAISNAVFRQEESTVNALGASDMFWQWGQFVDHDIDLTPEADPVEAALIFVPAGDVDFDPDGTGQVVIPFVRSKYVEALVPRQQVNVITAFIDASNAYGASEERARALRALDGSGRLKTSDGADGETYLPFNVDGLDNAGGTDASLFVAGDVRANEQIGLTAMHTLFLREHNRLADTFEGEGLTGDEIYLRARRVVAAQMQVITFREFLPLLLGPGAMPPYSGYDETVDPGIANLFSTAAYRFGHSLISDTVLRLDAGGNEIAEGHLALRDAFFNPTRLVNEGGMEPVLRGLSAQTCQELDAKIVEDLRSFLFGAPGAGGIDLAAMNIQRGRDHGLPNYNTARRALGLAPLMDVPDALLSIYTDVEDIDVWVGGLSEPRLPGAMVGETFHRILSDQFRRLRDGDRFWYQRIFVGPELHDLEHTKLSDIIRRNTNIGDELSDFALQATGLPAPRIPRSEEPAGPIDPDRQRRIARHFGGQR